MKCKQSILQVGTSGSHGNLLSLHSEEEAGLVAQQTVDSMANFWTGQCSIMQCSVVRCSAVQRGEVRCSAVQRGAVRCSAARCSTVQCSAMLRCEGLARGWDGNFAWVDGSPYDLEFWLDNEPNSDVRI